MSLTAASDDSTLYTYMTRSHDYLRGLLDRVLDSMRVEAPDLRALWTELEHGLLAHMEAEERFILPAFARVDGAEALALLREHGALREHLLELGVSIDLHCATFARSREFVDTLRRHAGREENLLYRWANDHLDQRFLEAIETRLNRPAHTMLH